MSQDVKVKFVGDATNLKAAAAQVRADVDAVTKRVQAQKAEMAELRGSVAGLAGAYIGIAAIKGEFDFAGRIQDIADRFGDTAEALQRVGAAAKPTGTDLESVVTAIQKVTVNAAAARDGNADMAAAFKSLGIDAGKFVNLPIDEKLTQLARGFSDATGDGDKLNRGIKVLGKSGGEILPLLKQGPDALRDSMQQATVMTDEEIGKLADLGDQADEAANKWRSVFGGAIVWVTDRIGEMVAILDAAVSTLIGRLGDVASSVESLSKGDLKGAASSMGSFLKNNATQGDLVENINGALENVRKAREEAVAKRKAERESKKNAHMTPSGNDLGGGDGGADAASTNQRMDGLRAGRMEEIRAAAAARWMEDQKKQAEDVAGLEADAAKIRHDAAMDELEDGERLLALKKELAGLDKQRAVGNLGQSEVERAQAEKRYQEVAAEVSGLQRKLAQSATREREEADQKSSEERKEKEAAAAERNKHLPGELAAQAFTEDSGNYSSGAINHPGKLRALQRRQAVEAAREARRRERGIGERPRPRQPGAAEDARNQGKLGKGQDPQVDPEGRGTSNRPTAQARWDEMKRESDSKKTSGQSEREKRQAAAAAMAATRKGMDAGDKKPAGGDGKDTMAEDVKALRKVIEERLPKKTT